MTLAFRDQKWHENISVGTNRLEIQGRGGFNREEDNVACVTITVGEVTVGYNEKIAQYYKNRNKNFTVW